MQISDANRLLALTANGDSTTLSPVAFRAEEEISAPFSVAVDAVSQNQAVDLDSLIFQPACLTVTQGGTPRYFNGMIRAVTASGLPVRGMWRYTLSIVPRLWFMGQTADCRIFQQKTVGDIVTTLCGEAGQSLDLKVFGTLPIQGYVTQYNETDLHFVSRLLEQAGLFYFFQHTAGAHTMVVTDSNQAFPAAPKPVLAVVHEGGNIDTLTEWRRVRSAARGSMQMLDYDPSAPANPVTATTPSKLAMAGLPKREVVHWPALSLDTGTVTDRTRFAIEAAEAEVSLTDAAGHHHMLMPGGRLQIYRDPLSSASNVEYAVRGVTHFGSDESWVAGSAQPEYSNALSLLPFDVPWRQAMVTPRPHMAGVFTGVVIGDGGEEIHADSLGRIKLRMIWDHRKETVAGQAVWVRVVQPWAGNSWGWQHLPRVGTEVAVAFMDGDPDRPVVIGGLYNADMPVVFAVPGEQTKSGFRSRSSKGGGGGNCSEFSIDDTKGSENVFLHAEKDMTREVENNDSLSVSNTQTITVAKGRAATVQNGGDKLTVQAGDLTISVQTGQVSVEALQSITLKVGQNTLVVDQSGVSIKGIMVQAEGQAMVSVKGPLVQNNADGMLMLKGGITMIN